MNDEKPLKGEIVLVGESQAPEPNDQADAPKISASLTRSNGKHPHPVDVYVQGLPAKSSKITQRSGLASILAAAKGKQRLNDLAESERKKFHRMVYEYPWWDMTREDYEAVIIALRDHANTPRPQFSGPSPRFIWFSRNARKSLKMIPTIWTLATLPA